MQATISMSFVNKYLTMHNKRANISARFGTHASLGASARRARSSSLALYCWRSGPGNMAAGPGHVGGGALERVPRPRWLAAGHHRVLLSPEGDEHLEAWNVRFVVVTDLLLRPCRRARGGQGPALARILGCSIGAGRVYDGCIVEHVIRSWECRISGWLYTYVYLPAI